MSSLVMQRSLVIAGASVVVRLIKDAQGYILETEYPNGSKEEDWLDCFLTPDEAMGVFWADIRSIEAPCKLPTL